MKHYIKTLILFTFIFSVLDIIGKPMDRLDIFLVMDDDAIFDNVGYNNCDMKTNGEKNILKIMHPGDVVFDIGANIGEWSQSLLDAESQLFIYCFEPIPAIYDELKSNFKKINVISTHQIAISHINSQEKFYYYPTIPALSTLHRRSETIENWLNIQPIPIDIYLEKLENFCEQKKIEHIDFVKIDTEGNEFNVLKGAEKLLLNQAIDFIQFEYGGCYSDSNTTLQEVYLYLTKHNFSIFRITSKGLIKINQWRDQLENFQYCNYLAVINKD